MLKWTSGGSLHVVETGPKFEAYEAKQATKGAFKTSDRPSHSVLLHDTGVLRLVQERSNFHERGKIGETCDESSNRNVGIEQPAELRDISVPLYPQEWGVNERQPVNLRKGNIFKKFKKIFKRSSSRSSFIKSAPSSPTVSSSPQEMAKNDIIPNSPISKDIDGRKPPFTSKDRKSRLERLIDAQRDNRRERERTSKSQTRLQAFTLDKNDGDRRERGRTSKSQTRLRTLSLDIHDDNRREKLRTSKSQTKLQLFAFDTNDVGNCRKCSEAGQRHLFWNNDSSTADISLNFYGKEGNTKQMLAKNKILTPPVMPHLKNRPVNSAIDINKKRSCKNYRSETKSDTCILPKKSSLKGMPSSFCTPKTSRPSETTKTNHEGSHNDNLVAEYRKQNSISLKDVDTAAWRRILGLSPRRDGDDLQQWIGKMRAIDSHTLCKAKRSLKKVRHDLDEETTQTGSNTTQLKRDTSRLFSWSRSQEGGMLVSPKTRLKHAFLLSSPISRKGSKMPLPLSDRPITRNNNNGHKHVSSHKYLDDLGKEDSSPKRPVIQSKDDKYLQGSATYVYKNDTLPITGSSPLRRPGYHSLDLERQSRVKRIVHTLEEKLSMVPAVKSSLMMANSSSIRAETPPFCQSPFQTQNGNKHDTTVKDYRASKPESPKTCQNIQGSKDDCMFHLSKESTPSDSPEKCLRFNQIHVLSDSKDYVKAVSPIENSPITLSEPQAVQDYSPYEDVTQERIGNTIFIDDELAFPTNNDKSMPTRSDIVFSDSHEPSVSGNLFQSMTPVQNNQMESPTGNRSPSFQLIRKESMSTQSDTDFSDVCAPDCNVSDGIFNSSLNIILAQSQQMESLSSNLFPPLELTREQSMPTKPNIVFSDSCVPDSNVSDSVFQSNFKKVLVEGQQTDFPSRTLPPPLELITNEIESQVDGRVIDNGNPCESETPKTQIEGGHCNKDDIMSDTIVQNHIPAKDRSGLSETQLDLKDEESESEDIIKLSDEIVHVSLSSGCSGVEKEERVGSSPISKAQEVNVPDVYLCTIKQQTVLKADEYDSEGNKQHGAMVSGPGSTEMFYDVRESVMENVSSPKPTSSNKHFMLMPSRNSGVSIETGSKDQGKEICDSEEHVLATLVPEYKSEQYEFSESLCERQYKDTVPETYIAIGQNSAENLTNFLGKTVESDRIIQNKLVNSEQSYSVCTTQVSSASADKAFRELSFSSSDISCLNDIHSMEESVKLATKSNSLFNMTFIFNEEEIESHSPDTPPGSPASMDATKENSIYKDDSQQELRLLAHSSPFDVHQGFNKEKADISTLNKNDMIVSGAGKSRKDKEKSNREKCIQVDLKHDIIYTERNNISPKFDVIAAAENEPACQSIMRSTEGEKVQNNKPCPQCLYHSDSNATLYQNQEHLDNGSYSRNCKKNDETYDISPWTESSPRNEGNSGMIQGDKMPFNEAISKDDAGLTLAARNQSADLVASRIIDYFNFVHSQELPSDDDKKEKVTPSSAKLSDSQSGLSYGISGDGSGDRSESSRSKEENLSDKFPYQFPCRVVDGGSESAFTDNSHVSFAASSKEFLSFKHHRQRHSGIRNKAHLKKKRKLTVANATCTKKPASEEPSLLRSNSNHGHLKESQSDLHTGTQEQSLFPSASLKDDDTTGKRLNEVNQSSGCHQGDVIVTKGLTRNNQGQWIFLGIMLFFQFLIHWLYAR